MAEDGPNLQQLPGLQDNAKANLKHPLPQLTPILQVFHLPAPQLSVSRGGDEESESAGWTFRDEPLTKHLKTREDRSSFVL